MRADGVGAIAGIAGRFGPRPRAQAQFVDSLRTALLHFDAELERGLLHRDRLQAGLLGSRQGPFAVRPFPAPPVRLAQAIALKKGRLNHLDSVLAPQQRAREALLGEQARGNPRFLIRVDEFPHYQAFDREGRGVEGYRRFHSLFAELAIPYLLAVVPRPAQLPLDPDAAGSRPLGERERELLAEVTKAGVEPALHGLSHRSRKSSPHRRSELCGLAAAELEELIAQGLGELERLGLRPQVFIPPFNRFEANQLATLGRWFRIVGGGPESVGLVGFQRGPQWRGPTVYLPSYPPFYGRAHQIEPAARRAIEEGLAVWIPLTLHFGWELEDGLVGLRSLLGTIAPYAVPWRQLLAVADRLEQDVPG